MAILAYDDVMLREPRLLVPNGRPVGPVQCIVPGPLVFAHLFDAKKSHGLPYEITPSGGGAYTPGGYAVQNANEEIGISLNLGSSALWTLLLDVELTNLSSEYAYMAGGNYQSGIGFFGRHVNVGYAWGVLGGSSVLAPTGAAALSATGRRIFGFSIIYQAANSMTVNCALDGRFYSSVAFGAPSTTTEWAFNTYDPGGDLGVPGAIYKAAVIVKRPMGSAELAALTADSAQWWAPA